MALRCVIVDPKGTPIPGSPFVAVSPPASLPHIGKFGWAELYDDNHQVRITLDDGTVIMGSDCWWEQVRTV